MLFFAVLPVWALILVLAAVVLVVGGSFYAVYRWGFKNKATTVLAFTGASAIFSVLQSVFKDDADKLDVHDFMKLLDMLCKAGVEVINKKEAGATFAELKDYMLTQVKFSIDVIPQLKGTVTDDYIE